jgi:hypothetical protein
MVPWDHVENVWELTSLMHEVGHDLEADLKLRVPLVASLTQKLRAAGVPETRIARWAKWEGETFADLVALQLGGPAFAYALFHLLLLPGPTVTMLDPDDPHPNHYVRILMNAAYVLTLVPGNASLKGMPIGSAHHGSIFTGPIRIRSWRDTNRIFRRSSPR